MAKTSTRSIRKRTKKAKIRKYIIYRKEIVKETVDSLITNVIEEIEFKNTKYCHGILKAIIDDAVNIGSNDVSDNNEYDFRSFIPEEEYTSIENHELCIIKEKHIEQISGYRIVQMDYFLTKIIPMQSTHNLHCTGGKLEFFSEKKKGLVSTFTFKCNICDREVCVSTEDPKMEKSEVNMAAVWGTLSTGSSYAHLSEFFSVINVPTISGNEFFNIQRELSEYYKESLWEAMEAAGKEEHRLAIENEDVDPDGIPYITVCLDGGWSKRSYGHNYNAASGVAVIIGRRTSKILFIGVRNKYCSICARAENKSIAVGSHLCFKNFTGSSSSMEWDIIVEGFNLSISMHQLRYKTFIADGDSTVFSRIKQNVVYGSEVVKIECVNHCIKNYSKQLYHIKNDTKGIPLEARKCLSDATIKRLVKKTQKAIYCNAHGDLAQLKDDMRNTVSCVFGNHANCREYMCDSVKDVTKDLTKVLITSGLHHHIYAALNMVISKGRQLIDNETNNRAELFMSILARFNMGKRLNLIQRDSFQIRAYLSAMRYNIGQNWHHDSWKKCFKKSPGKVLKKYMTQQTQKHEKRKQQKQEKPKHVKRLKFSASDKVKVVEKDYGANIAEINLSSEEIQEETNKLIRRLTVSLDEQKEIAQQTIGQFDNPKFISEKLNCLTASNFGAVIHRRATTSCNALVKSILKPIAFTCTAAMDYGKRNEIVAIGKFQELTGKVVSSAGLYIDVLNGFLGASPDGIISESEIVEVKCSYKVAQLGITLEMATRNKQVSYLEINEFGKIQLKRNHNYFYQVQGQLAIVGAQSCFFIIYTGDKNKLHVEEIQFDEVLWHTVMLPKLKEFYIHCIAPNIIENRPARGLKCKEPVSVIEAQEKVQNKQRKKKEKKI